MKMKKMLSPEEDFSDVSYTYLHKYKVLAASEYISFDHSQ